MNQPQDLDPIDRLVDEVRAALSSNLLMVGLMSSLALIDMCAALDSDDGRTSRVKFEAWFTQHFTARYFDFDASDAYQLRCGTLHQGKLASTKFEALIFTLGGSTFVHNNLASGALNLDLHQFCEDILTTVEGWWAANRERETVAQNASELARIRPKGLPGYLTGRPVLA